MRIRNILMLLAFTMALALAASADPRSVATFTAEDRFDPFGILGPPVGAFIPSDVRVECPGYQPTGDPMMPCPPESRTHLYNVVIMSRVTSSDPSAFSSGWMIIAGNSFYDANFTGAEMGTYTLMMDDGGILAGRWRGVRTREGDHWVLPLQVNGRISGGALDGSTYLADERIVTYTPIPIAYVATVEGRITNYR